MSWVRVPPSAYSQTLSSQGFSPCHLNRLQGFLVIKSGDSRGDFKGRFKGRFERRKLCRASGGASGGAKSPATSPEPETSPAPRCRNFPEPSYRALTRKQKSDPRLCRQIWARQNSGG